MLVRTARGDTEIQAAFESTSRISSWSEFSGWDTWSGTNVNRNTIGGLPAATAAIRLISETVGMIPLLVYSGDAVDRERARRTWQWRILHDQPNEDQSPFDFKQDLSSSIETSGNAYIWKMKVRRQVEQAFVLDPAIVKVKRVGGRKIFEVTVNGETQVFTPSQILHVRGWTIQAGADEGLSPISYHRHALGSALAINEFEGRFFRNNASPGGGIEVPGDVDAETLNMYRQQWEENHAGLGNAHRPAVFKNGAKWTPIGLSLEDAQFIQSKEFSVEEVSRIFRISAPGLLSMVGKNVVNETAAEDFERFLKIDLAPRLSRIEQAFMSDRDFFEPGGEVFPEFLADAILRPDIKTRYEAYRLARQGGWLTPNEMRAKENLPPVEGGDEIQETPVGGAPNT